MKRYFCNLIDVLCLSSCGIFACIATETVPDQIPAAMTQNMWIALGVAVLLLLLIPRLTKAVWNVVFCITTMVLMVELAALASQGLALPASIRDMSVPYTFLSIWESGGYYLLGSFALLWVMGALCGLGFWRVVFTSVGCCAGWFLLAFGLQAGGEAWLAMEDAPLAESQALLIRCPWVTAAIPAVFVVSYGIMMSLYDGFTLPWPSKKKGDAPAPAPVPAVPLPAAVAKPAAATKPAAKPTAAATKPAVAAATATKPAATATAKAAAPAAKADAKPAAAPKLPAKPVLKTAATTAAAPAAKPVLKPVAAPAPKAEEKPAEKPAEPKAEEKPAEKPAEPKAEEKPAEKPAEEAKPAAPAEEAK